MSSKCIIIYKQRLKYEIYITVAGRGHKNGNRS